MTPSPARAPRRGIVLGGGGVLGAAWMVGALCALEDVMGVDATKADVIVGTSAGSVLASLLAAGVTPRQLRDHQRGGRITDGPLAGFVWDHDNATGGSRPLLPHFGPGSLDLLRGSMSRLWKMPPTAVLSGFVPRGRGSLERVGHLIEAMTPMDAWSPHPGLRVIAMDYASGKRVAFGAPDAPPASLARAVMSSCAIPGWFSPVRIGDRTYVDGGACSATSADVAAGHGLDEVYVLAPMVSFAMDSPSSVVARLERRWRVQVTRRCLHEVRKVRAEGAAVRILGPGPDDLVAMGANAMDVTRRRSVLETSLVTSMEALRDPRLTGPDHLADAG